MEKATSTHVHVEAAPDELELQKAVAHGIHIERKLLDGEDIVLIPTPSDDPRGSVLPQCLYVSQR